MNNDDIIVLPEEDDEAAAPAALAELPDENAAEALAKLPRGAKRQADGTILYTLTSLISLRYRKGEVVKEEQVDSFTFREMTGADMRKLATAGASIDGTVMAMALSTGTQAGRMGLLFDRMKMADINACGEIIGFLSGASLTTGR